jgi:DNA-binding LacI/PurR family transcriptional regulator
MVDPARELGSERARQVFFDRLASEKGIVGIITCYVRLSDVLVRRLEQRGLPVVMMEHTAAYGRCVVIDQVKATRRAVKAFVRAGKRRIGCVIPAEDEDPVWRDRLAGYRQGLKEGRLGYDPVRVVHPEWVGVLPGERATLELLERDPAIDAVLYGSDTLAAGGLVALRAAGRTVPGDVAVIGFDDEEFAPALVPPLASIRQPIGTMAGTALRLLFDSMENNTRTPQKIMLEAELIQRASARPD